MAGNNYGLNSATKMGEGDANIIQWGNLDRAANQIYQEQKQKEARGYNDYMQGQAALQKEFANVRSADIPDVVNAYNDLKRTKQQLLFDDKIKNDAIKYAQVQQQAQLKEAALRQQIAASQQLKESDKAINARMLSHPDDFEENAGQMFVNHQNLPLKDRIKIGALGQEPYLYKGVDMAKLGSLAKQAAGTPRIVPIGEPQVADEGYKLEQKMIQRGNNPVQYADNMYKGMQTNKFGQAARTLLNQMSPQKAAQITQQFAAIPDAEFEQKWGVKKSALTNGVLPDDKAGQYVLLDAMQYAVNNMPTESKSEFRPNEAFKNEKNIEEWNRRNGITFNQSKIKIGLNKAEKPAEAYDFLKKGAEVLGSGNADLANDYFSAWKAQGKLDAQGKQVGFDKISYTPAGWVKVNYNMPVNKNGITIGIPQEVILNPKDPQLLNKLTGLHQQFLGSDTKVEKAAQGASMKKTTTTPKPTKGKLY